jgi:hypothetical protein
MSTIKLCQIPGTIMGKNSTLKNYSLVWILSSSEAVKESALVQKRFISWDPIVKSIKPFKYS